MLTALSMLIALVIDWAIGWPDAVYRRIGHPVTWIGRLITALEHRLNRPGPLRRAAGIATTVAVVGVVAGLATAIARTLPDGLTGAIIAGILAWPLVAARAMFTHVEAVRLPLAASDLAHARTEVAKIVGRDPEMLDAPGVARASIESLAENTSDGIIAPLFWGALFGLPGIAGYKAINTLDSMIGHKTERYQTFGWAAARLDDLVNLIPARLTGLMFALASRSSLALTIMRRDARQHRSPNAGWPEAAMAGALNIRLSGPRGYGGAWSVEPWVNDGAPDPTADDVARAQTLYRKTLVLGALLLALVAAL